MKKLFLVAGLLLMGACASTTEPTVARKSAAKVSKDFTCDAGYLVAFDADGDPFCVPIE